MSEVWNYFVVDSTDNNRAVCKICRKTFSRGGRSQNTSNLRKHVTSIHRIKFAESSVENRFIPSSSDAATSEIEEPFDCPSLTKYSSTTSSLSESEIPAKEVQPTISDFIAKKTTFKPGDPRSKAITRKIAYMICKDNQPFSIVEDTGFNQLLHHLEPRYILPSRKHLSNQVIPEMYGEVESRVRIQLLEAEHVAVTTDLWTSTACDDYLSVTVHFVDEEYKLQHKCIEVVPFDEVRHTATNIANFLKRTLESWNLNSRLVAVIHDNGPNVVSAMTLGNFPHLSCLAHTFQLVVKEGLESKNILNVISLCRRLVGSFKHSSKATKILKAAQKHLSIPNHRLIQDEPTRWNSTLHMLRHLKKQRRAIMFASTDISLPVQLTSAQWDLIDSLVETLNLFDHSTLAVSSSSVSISEVIPIVNSTVSELKKPAPSGSGIITARETMLSSLKRRYRDIEVDQLCSIATLLDPRLKGHVFSAQEVFETAKDRLLTLLNQEQPENTNNEVCVLFLSFY